MWILWTRRLNFGSLDGKGFLKDVINYERYKKVPSRVGISLPAVLYILVEHTLAFWFFLSRIKNVCGVDTS